MRNGSTYAADIELESSNYSNIALPVRKEVLLRHTVPTLALLVRQCIVIRALRPTALREKLVRQWILAEPLNILF